MRTHALLASILAGAVAAASCGHGAPPPATGSAPARPPHAPTQSNVLRSDYVGSSACAACHAKETAAWARSPMHEMTRLPDAPDVHTPFDGRTMHLKGDTVS